MATAGDAFVVYTLINTEGERQVKMMREYISTEELSEVIADLREKIAAGKMEECDGLLERLLEDGKIDKAYIDSLKEKKRSTRISDINRMLSEMSLRQLDNVRKYVSDEYDEPDHEAEALNAIIELSRKGKQRVTDES